MKSKLYIATYNNRRELDKTLESMRSTSKELPDEVFIMNDYTHEESDNEPDLFDPMYNNMVTHVYNDELRPNFSTGYLSRSWNNGLIFGFKDLKDPDADIVILCQDDTLFHDDWYKKLLKVHNTYDFITQGWGDNFMSFSPEAVKRVGLFDERIVFGGVAAEYFMRQLLLNKENATINDHYHDRVVNPIDIEIAGRPPVKKIHRDSRRTGRLIGYAVFDFKFPGLPFRDWPKSFVDNPPKKYGSYNFVMYPFFETGVETLNEQNYVGYSDEFKKYRDKYYYESKKDKK